MTRFSILTKWWLRHGVHNFVLRNLHGLGMASNFRRMKPLLLPFLALWFIAAPSGPAEAGAHSLDSKELLNTAYPKARIDAPTVGTNAAPLRIPTINLPNVRPGDIRGRIANFRAERILHGHRLQHVRVAAI